MNKNYFIVSSDLCYTLQGTRSLHTHISGDWTAISICHLAPVAVPGPAGLPAAIPEASSLFGSCGTSCVAACKSQRMES